MTPFLFLLLSHSSGAWDAKTFKMPTQEQLKRSLSPMQFKVTQHEGTEPPFKNEYWDHKAEGIYVDIVSGEPLFSSADKYDSGTGWPSFTQPLTKEFITTKEDRRLFGSKRVEVRSRLANSHLGHVFEDGPKPTGLRYCMNSAALQFIPADKLATMGYAEFVKKKSALASNATAIFAGGCFWCVEKDFELLKGKGVIDVVSGYSGGTVKNPTYKQVGGGTTGHYEVVQVTYDATKIKYSELVEYFWRTIDPLDDQGQFCDKGQVYKSVIFTANAEEKDVALKSMADINKILKGQSMPVGVMEKATPDVVKTKVLDRVDFYPAEDYHQDYYKKNPIRYSYYRSNCGRDSRLKEVWGQAPGKN